MVQLEARAISKDYPGVGMLVEELKRLQQEDPTLESARKIAGEEESSKGFFQS